MSDTRTEFEERIGRAVRKFFHHAEGEGLDATAVQGATVTVHADGSTTFQYGEPARATTADKRTRKAATK